MHKHNQYQHEPPHGFLRGWCHVCPPRAANDKASPRRRRPRFFAATIWALVLLCLPLVQGCAALGAFFMSPAGQALAAAVVPSVVDLAVGKLADTGVDVTIAPGCIDLEEVAPDVDPTELCLLPGGLDAAAVMFPQVNALAVRRLRLRGLQADTAAALCQEVDGPAGVMTACVYPAGGAQ